jgi:glycosyltransferase involved in cell wall biosynthesis
MRVAHITPATFGEDGVWGGGERYALELARHMADKADTVLIAFGPRDRRERMGNLEIRVIGKPWHVRGERSNPIALGMLGALRGADVVHCHQRYLLATSVAALAARMAGRRIFVSDLGGGGWDISAWLRTDRWFHGHLHLSDFSRRLSGHDGEPFAHVIFGGVDTEKFSPDAAVARGRAALYAGRILPHKGVDYLIEAAGADDEIWIAGRVADEAYLTDLRRLANGKRVAFYHDRDDAGLIAAYRRALCVVLPSVHRDRHGNEFRAPELLGQTLLEGMACGAPAVCTSVASLPEIVDDGVTGFVVPPNDPAALGDRIAWLRSHPEEAAAMGAAGRRRVLEKFTWPRVVERCLRIYAMAAGGRIGA